MATITTEFASRNLQHALTAPFRAVWGFLMAMSLSHRLNREFEVLNAMSDAELAKLGLTRADVPQFLLRNYTMV